MYLAKLAHAKRIYPLNEQFEKIFDYLRNHDLLTMPLGRIELDGDAVFINNALEDAVSQASQVLEVHQQYLDIHILLEGHERIGWKALEDLSVLKQAYDAQKDFALYDEQPSTFVDLYPGDMAIVFPEDAHAPIIGEGKIRKAVVKIKLI